MQTLEMELFLDTYEAHKAAAVRSTRRRRRARSWCARSTDLMDIDPSTHAPPVLLFTWGSLAFTCVLARATQRFMMFLPDGTPVRARLNVTFNEFRNAELEAKEVKRETADYSQASCRARRARRSPTIAGASTATRALWRPIAIANGIDDPRAPRAGQQLLLPQLPFRDPR